MMGRPPVAPAVYFRLLLIGYFEGIDSKRGIVLRRQLGFGKPRAFQRAVSALRKLLVRARAALEAVVERLGRQIRALRVVTEHSSPAAGGLALPHGLVGRETFTTGC